MALRWDWKNQIGNLTIDGKTYSLYEGNAFMICLREYEKEGETYWDMVTFFVDKDHAKRCLGLAKGHKNIWEDCPWERLELKRSVYNYWKELTQYAAKAFPNIEITLLP